MLLRFPARPYRRALAAAWAAALAGITAGCSIAPGGPAGRADVDASEVAFATASQRALEYLPDLESLEWTDPVTREPARITILETLIRDDGAFCRLVYIEHGTAAEPRAERYCRTVGASWVFDGQVVEVHGAVTFGGTANSVADR